MPGSGLAATWVQTSDSFSHHGNHLDHRHPLKNSNRGNPCSIELRIFFHAQIELAEQPTRSLCCKMDRVFFQNQYT